MKTLTKQKNLAVVTLGVFGATLLGSAFAPLPVQADSKTWKKVAIGAGAVTAYGLIKGKGKVATVGGIATAGSYLKYRSDKKKENRKKAWYKQRYGRNWQRHYR